MKSLALSHEQQILEIRRSAMTEREKIKSTEQERDAAIAKLKAEQAKGSQADEKELNRLYTEASKLVEEVGKKKVDGYKTSFEKSVEARKTEETLNTLYKGQEEVLGKINQQHKDNADTLLPSLDNAKNKLTDMNTALDKLDEQLAKAKALKIELDQPSVDAAWATINDLTAPATKTITVVTVAEGSAPVAAEAAPVARPKPAPVTPPKGGTTNTAEPFVPQTHPAPDTPSPSLPMSPIRQISGVSDTSPNPLVKYGDKAWEGGELPHFAEGGEVDGDSNLVDPSDVLGVMGGYRMKPGLVGGLSHAAGTAGTTLSVINEVNRVREEGLFDENTTGLDKTAVLSASAARMATATLGAELAAPFGAAAGPFAPIAVPVLGALGGAAGYFLGDQAVQLLQGKRDGGLLEAFANGGPVDLRTGGKLPGYSTQDDTLALLRKGEFVVQSEAVPGNRELLEKINRFGAVKKFATGGLVDDPTIMPGFDKKLNEYLNDIVGLLGSMGIAKTHPGIAPSSVNQPLFEIEKRMRELEERILKAPEALQDGMRKKLQSGLLVQQKDLENTLISQREYNARPLGTGGFDGNWEDAYYLQPINILQNLMDKIGKPDASTTVGNHLNNAMSGITSITGTGLSSTPTPAPAAGLQPIHIVSADNQSQKATVYGDEKSHKDLVDTLKFHGMTA